MKLFATAIVALGAAVLASNAFAAPKLSPQERRAINRVVDGFVFHAVRHKNPAAAYDLVSPTFRAGMSRAEFARKDPAYPYPARGRHYPWSLDYVEPNEVGGSLLLQPSRKGEQEAWSDPLRPARDQASGTLGGRVAHPEGDLRAPQQAQGSFGAGLLAAEPGDGPTYDRSRISGTYIVIPFAAFGALLLGLACWGVVRWYRDRRIASASVRARDTRARATH